MSRWESDPRQYAADRLAAGKTLADLLPADHEPETAAPNDGWQWPPRSRGAK